MTDPTPADAARTDPLDRATAGPFDETEANPVRPYIDLGGIKILPREGLNLRLEVEEQTKRIVAVGLDYAGSTLQVQPFAAPRTTGLWEETREQIRGADPPAGRARRGARRPARAPSCSPRSPSRRAPTARRASASRASSASTVRAGSCAA